MKTKIAMTKDMEVGKFYLGVGERERGTVYYITGVNDDNTSVIGYRVESTGGTLSDVAPAGNGIWKEIDKQQFLRIATQNFDRMIVGRINSALEVLGDNSDL